MRIEGPCLQQKTDSCSSFRTFELNGKLLIMLEELRELWRYREMLATMVQRELKIRYKNSILGFFWSILNPLITVAVMTIVFRYIENNPMKNLAAYILAAYLPYMFFQLALLDSAQSVLNGLPLAKKIYFPREILPLSMILSNFIHFLLSLLVFFAYLFVVMIAFPGKSPFNWMSLYLPLFLVINLALVTGLGLIISALNTFYEDVKYLVAVSLYLSLFILPIMYFVEQVKNAKIVERHPWIYTLYMLNPPAALSEAYRKILVAQPSEIKVISRTGPSGAAEVAYRTLPLNWNFMLACAAFSFGILIFGYSFFNRLKWKFVERP